MLAYVSGLLPCAPSGAFEELGAVLKCLQKIHCSSSRLKLPDLISLNQGREQETCQSQVVKLQDTTLLLEDRAAPKD